MDKSILITLLTALPTTATAVSTVYLNSQRKKDKEAMKRASERNAAKSSIQNMITQDIIRVELLGKLPENKDAIEKEYENYHKLGGNGTITRQVHDYDSWYNSKELCMKCHKTIMNEAEQECKLGIVNGK